MVDREADCSEGLGDVEAGIEGEAMDDENEGEVGTERIRVAVGADVGITRVGPASLIA